MKNPKFDKWCIAIDRCETVEDVMNVTDWFEPFIKEYDSIYVEFFVEHRNEKLDYLKQNAVSNLEKQMR